jgi:hypothetical protein
MVTSLRDLDPRKTAVARASSIYKRQTHPLAREESQKNKIVPLKQ